MAEPKRPLKVFLCHASQDKPRVRELYRYLRKRGVEPWLDAENLLPGQDWQIEIPKAIASSDAIIICFSKQSVDKAGYVQKEIRFALDKALEMPEGRIFLIPARLEECEVPHGFQRYHWVDLFETDGYPKIMKSLKMHAAQLQRTVVEIPRPGETNPNISGRTISGSIKQEKKVENLRITRPIIVGAGVLIGIIAIIIALIGFLSPFFKPTVTATATRHLTLTLAYTPTPLFAHTPTLSATLPTLTSTMTITATPTFFTPTVTVTPTNILMVMETTNQGNKFTFHIKNIPTVCTQVSCELRWTVWQGSLIPGKGVTYSGGHLFFYDSDVEFIHSRYDSNWKIVDESGLTLPYYIIAVPEPNRVPEDYYLVNFKICTDLGIRNNCKAISDEFSRRTQ